MKNSNQQLNYIFQNVQTSFGFIGLISEILIISVFLRKRLRNNSYAFYSILIAFFEIVICLHTFRHWAAFMFDANIDLVAQFLCAIGEYQPYVASTTSLWLHVIISYDRYVTIAYSNRFQHLKKRWFQALIAIIVIVCNLLMHIELPLYYTLKTINGTDITVCSIPVDVFNIQLWVYLANIFIINLVVINILNFKMIHYLVKTRNGLNLNNPNRRSVIKDRKFAISTVALNIANFISKMPLCVSLLVSYYLEFSIDSVRLLFTICVSINILFYALSFGIYMLLNSIFYEEFCLMIGFRKSRILPNIDCKVIKMIKK